MKNLRKLVNRNLLVVFATAMLLLPIVASAGDTPLKKPQIKEENSFAVTIDPQSRTKGSKIIAVTRFYDAEKNVTCYVTTTGGISCLQPANSPLSLFRENFEKVKEEAVINPTPENIAAYKKLEEESRRKALEFTNAVQKAMQKTWDDFIANPTTNSSQTTGAKPSKTTYLPAGSFANAVLITGAQLPPMDNKNTSIPAMLKITGPVNLPNNATSTMLDGCFVIAEWHAEATSKRVALRLSKLSCTDKDGKTSIDQPIQGYVVDASDNKNGLHGKVTENALFIEVEPNRKATIVLLQGVTLVEKN